ncbi:MAG TPA: NlpC/P60 family protein [Propionibacteriaceae bacterium]
MVTPTTGPARGSRRPRTASRTWLRTALAVPTALALSLPLFALAGAVQASPAVAAVGDPCPTAPSAPSVTGGSREAVARRAAARYFPAGQVATATAIAGAESSWNPTAVNKAAGGNYGLWQINSVHKKLLEGRDWRNPETNAWMAYQVWDAADGDKGNRSGSWTPWSVYNSGSYRAHLREGAAPVDAGVTDCATATTGAPEVRVGSWNVLKSNSKARIQAGLAELATRADVFGLQEMGSSSKRAMVKNTAGFTMSLDRTAVPILYRTDKYTLIAQGRQQAFPSGQKVESHGGSSVTGAKFVSWVQLQDIATSQSFYVLNTHLLVGAQNSEKQRKNNKKRVALYNRQLATVTSLADGFRASGASVYVACDCNVNYAADVSPIVSMREHGLTANWQTLDGKATHGKRYIDYVWSNQAPSSQVTGGNHGSDHRVLVVTYQSTAMSLLVAGPRQTTQSIRPVTDPRSGRMFLVPIPAGKAGKVINKALDELGDQWKFGAQGPAAWDCSGLTSRAYKAAGISIPAQSGEQRSGAPHVSLAQADPGDIFWRKGYVAIYLGTLGGQRMVIGSLRSSGAVVIHTADESDIKTVLRPRA